MIVFENGVFSLNGEGFTYLFRIGKHGQLEHLHFGIPVATADVEALACKNGTGWGCSVAYDADGTCLDVLPAEWSGSGWGDYRQTPIELERNGNPYAADFNYSSHEILDGSAPMEGGLPQAQDALQTLVITMKEPGGMVLKLYYSLFSDVITRRTVLINETESVVNVKRLMSFCLDIPGSFELTSFHGSWIAEMRPERTAVGSAEVTLQSTTGFSSNRHQPGFIISEPQTTENAGRAYGFNLIYSGNHFASCQRSFQGLTRIQQGISPDHFSWEMQPGDSFFAPEAVLACSDLGFQGVSQRLHRFINGSVVPKYWQYRDRPVLYNSWEGCMFDFNRARLLDLAGRARKLGCELFVLDDGWFGKRNHDRAGLGDYEVNRKKLPGGLKALADRINALGMQFGLWFEPEAVNPDSDLYRAHPDWALHTPNRDIYGRNELLLDLTRREVRDYIVEQVSNVLDNANITYVKWDMNRNSTALGAQAHKYILGLYEVLRRIFEPRPHILLEGCASGGNRFDLGMLCFAPQIWCSDDTDPIERLTIQNSLSYLYPQSVFGAHVSAAPHAQTLRNTPLSTRGNVSFFGILGYELDLKHLLPIEEKEIENQIAFYKDYRRCFQFGVFRRLPAPEGVAWQVSSGRVHLAGLFHKLVPAAAGFEQLRLGGLDREKRYGLCSRQQLLRVGQFGGLVKHIVPVELNPYGLVLRTADRLYPMYDGVEEMTASGGALESGIMLSPRFAGTGYDSKSRNQGDFCSNVYVIREI